MLLNIKYVSSAVRSDTRSLSDPWSSALFQHVADVAVVRGLVKFVRVARVLLRHRAGVQRASNVLV